MMWQFLNIFLPVTVDSPDSHSVPRIWCHQSLLESHSYNWWWKGRCWAWGQDMGQKPHTERTLLNHKIGTVAHIFGHWFTYLFPGFLIPSHPVLRPPSHEESCRDIQFGQCRFIIQFSFHTHDKWGLRLLFYRKMKYNGPQSLLYTTGA